MSAKSFVDEQLNALSSLCELDAQTREAFSSALLPIAEAQFSKMGAGVTEGGKIKLSKKATGKTRVTKPREDKISNKNAYHIFVAAKMAEVKGNNVPAKERMTAIGQLWKALDEDGKKPYAAQAASYNAYIAEQMKSDDWKARRDDIMKEANAHAGAPVADVPVEVEAEAEVAEEVAEPTPAPVAAPATVVKTKTETKPKAK
jgi:hypothetical protein